MVVSDFGVFLGGLYLISFCKRICRIFLLASIFIFSVAFHGLVIAGDSISRGRPYLVSPAPNYSSYAPSVVTKALTDGVFTSGVMWLQSGSLGWAKSGIVSIVVDLGISQAVDSVSVHTARRKAADVQFPNNVFVYLSDDGVQYAFAGDAVTRGNDDDAYGEMRFVLSGVGGRARYVRLEIVPRGAYFFTDEIEIIGGGLGRGLTPLIPAASVGGDVAHRAEESRSLKMELLAMADLDRAGAPPGSTSLVRRAALLTKNFPGRNIVVGNVNPWQMISPQSLPAGTFLSGSDLVVPAGSCGFRGFSITNPGTKSVSIRFEQAGLVGTLFEAKSVLTANYEYVFDPLVDATAGVDLPAGATSMLLLKICGGGTNSLTIAGGRDRITARTSVKEVGVISDADYPSAVVWAYPELGILQGRGISVDADLRAHHTRVMVLPPSSFPRLGEKDFGRAAQLFARYKDMQKVLMFMDFRNHPPKLEDAEWRARFVQWYRQTVAAAQAAGLGDKTLVLYPYDEPRKSEVQTMRTFVDWARKELVGVQFFATIQTKDALDLLPVLDIACIHRALMPVFGGGETWVYDTQGPGKANPPYAYYRLLPWFAYANQARGVGFWSYGDTSGSAWDDFDGPIPDYAVVYDGPGKSIVSSRRWEAWGQGLDDIALLKRYASRYGAAEAQRLAKTVVSAPDNSEKADETRRIILDSLSGNGK